MGMATSLWKLSLGLALSVGTRAGDQKQPEVLPPPRALPQPIAAPSATIPPAMQPDPYWKMRLYTRDRYGYLRPRVIYGPYGAYYPLTGEPYPYTAVKGVR